MEYPTFPFSPDYYEITMTDPCVSTAFIPVTTTYSASYTIGEIDTITVSEMAASANGGNCGDYEDIVIIFTSGPYDLISEFDTFSWPLNPSGDFDINLESYDV